jgi:hypothetical protein
MNASDLLAQLEDELTWRQNEIRLLHNQLAFIEKNAQRDVWRKALVVMLYSHLEGFCKSAFCYYAEAVNKEKLRRQDVNYPLAASCFEEPFKMLRDQSHKHAAFKGKTAPNDTQLHQFYRESTFIENVDAFLTESVEIPVDKVVSTESNLTPTVLQKLLYRLGFDPDALAPQHGDISLLVNNRHSIAHGRQRNGIDEMTYERVRRATYAVMDGVKRLIFLAASKKAHLRSA